MALIFHRLYPTERAGLCAGYSVGDESVEAAATNSRVATVHWPPGAKLKLDSRLSRCQLLTSRGHAPGPAQMPLAEAAASLTRLS